MWKTGGRAGCILAAVAAAGGPADGGAVEINAMAFSYASRRLVASTSSSVEPELEITSSVASRRRSSSCRRSDGACCPGGACGIGGDEGTAGKAGGRGTPFIHTP